MTKKVRFLPILAAGQDIFNKSRLFAHPDQLDRPDRLTRESSLILKIDISDCALLQPLSLTNALFKSKSSSKDSLQFSH